MSPNNLEVTGLNKPTGWQEFWLKEDWWAVWLGLGIVLLAYVFYLAGSSISWIAVAPTKWSTLSELAAQLFKNGIRYLAAHSAFSGFSLFSVMVSFIGQKPREFIPSFIFVFILSTIIYAAGNWDQASKYNLEPPLVALVIGLIISNLIGLPRWLDAGFRVEFFIKLGIVLLGATLPFHVNYLGRSGGYFAGFDCFPSLPSTVIFFTARKLGLDHRLAAVLGAGGAVCGVSASIAVAGAVRAKKEHPPIAISLVVFWAIVLHFCRCHWFRVRFTCPQESAVPGSEPRNLQTLPGSPLLNPMADWLVKIWVSPERQIRHLHPIR